MELELRRLEDLAESIVNDFAYMRAREEEMRDTNGKCVHVYSVDDPGCQVIQYFCPYAQYLRCTNP